MQDSLTMLRESAKVRNFDKENQPTWAFSTQKKLKRSQSSHKNMVNHSMSIEETLKKHLFCNKDQDDFIKNSLSNSKYGQVISSKKKRSV